MKPSDHLKRGECPYCCAEGQIENIIFGMVVCPLCQGTKRWPPPDDPSWAEARATVE
jgi:hypothetical protein